MCVCVYRYFIGIRDTSTLWKSVALDSNTIPSDGVFEKTNSVLFSSMSLCYVQMSYNYIEDTKR